MEKIALLCEFLTKFLKNIVGFTNAMPSEMFETVLSVICKGCLDMLATEGYFTFVASRPQLACAAFIIAEPSEVISMELSDVSIDCSAGDFIKVVPK